MPAGVAVFVGALRKLTQFETGVVCPCRGKAIVRERSQARGCNFFGFPYAFVPTEPAVDATVRGCCKGGTIPRVLRGCERVSFSSHDRATVASRNLAIAVQFAELMVRNGNVIV